jgi:hypothetical protein
MNRMIRTLVLMASLALLAASNAYCQMLPQMQQGQQMPMQMPPMQPGPLEGMWMANNGQVSAMFQGNFYVIGANNQAVEGGTYLIQGGEMITQIMQGQGAGQQMRYNYQPGPDGKSFTLTMQNGSGSITYQRTGGLPPMPPPQAMPQPGGWQEQQAPQPMPQQLPQQMPQPFPQPQYPQPMPQQQYPQMQQMPQQ